MIDLASGPQEAGVGQMCTDQLMGHEMKRKMQRTILVVGKWCDGWCL